MQLCNFIFVATKGFCKNTIKLQKKKTVTAHKENKEHEASLGPCRRSLDQSG